MFDESKHPRDSDGKFTNKEGGASKKATLNDIGNTIKGNRAKQKSPEISLSKKEWAMWYRALGDIKRGMYVPKRNGKKLIVIGNKIVFTSGTYTSPRAEKVLEFDDWDDLERFLKNG